MALNKKKLYSLDSACVVAVLQSKHAETPMALNKKKLYSLDSACVVAVLQS